MRYLNLLLGLSLAISAFAQTPRVPSGHVCALNLSAQASFDPYGRPVIYYCAPTLQQYRAQTVRFLFAHEETHVALHIAALARAPYTLAGRDVEAEADSGAIRMLAGSFSQNDWNIVLADIQQRNPAIAARVAYLLQQAGLR